MRRAPPRPNLRLRRPRHRRRSPPRDIARLRRGASPGDASRGGRGIGGGGRDAAVDDAVDDLAKDAFVVVAAGNQRGRRVREVTGGGGGGVHRLGDGRGGRAVAVRQLGTVRGRVRARREGSRRRAPDGWNGSVPGIPGIPGTVIPSPGSPGLDWRTGRRSPLRSRVVWGLFFYRGRRTRRRRRRGGRYSRRGRRGGCATPATRARGTGCSGRRGWRAPPRRFTRGGSNGRRCACRARGFGVVAAGWSRGGVRRRSRGASERGEPERSAKG